MENNNEKNSDPFVWISGGEEVKSKEPDSIQSIQPSLKSRATKRRSLKPSTPAAKAGLKSGWIRATFIVREEYLDKLKSLAYWDRKDIKTVLDEALERYLTGKKIKSVKNR
jgi:hypothetical protein